MILKVVLLEAIQRYKHVKKREGRTTYSYSRTDKTGAKGRKTGAAGWGTPWRERGRSVSRREGPSGKVGAWPEAKVSTQWLPEVVEPLAARQGRNTSQTKQGAGRPQNCRGCTNQLCWRDCSFTPHSHVVRSDRLLEGRSPDQSPIDIYECPESGFCSWFQTSNGYSTGFCNHETTWTHSRSFKSDVASSNRWAL